jgi:hypothetical protein
MSNSYEWLVEDVERLKSFDGKADVVSAVHWRCNAHDNATPPNRATLFGVQEMSYIPSSGFMEFNLLTKQQLVEWAKQSMGSDVDSVQQNLDAQLAEQAIPSVIRGLPGQKQKIAMIVE